jgi:hypothetical protein
LQASRAARGQAGNLPPLRAGALLWEAQQNIELPQHRPWLGNRLVAAGLREVKKTKAHQLRLNASLRLVSGERHVRRKRKSAVRPAAFEASVNYRRLARRVHRRPGARLERNTGRGLAHDLLAHPANLVPAVGAHVAHGAFDLDRVLRLGCSQREQMFNMRTICRRVRAGP